MLHILYFGHFCTVAGCLSYLRFGLFHDQKHERLVQFYQVSKNFYEKMLKSNKFEQLMRHSLVVTTAELAYYLCLK